MLSSDMNECEYKKITKQEIVFRRGVLEETICVMRSTHPKIADKLQGIINYGPIDKPEKHRGGPETDFFRVKLEQFEKELIVDTFGDLEALSISLLGETTPKASHYAAMLDIWNANT